MKKILTPIKIIIGVLLFLLIYLQIGVNQIISTLKQTNLLILLIGVVLIGVMFIIAAINNYILLKALKQKIAYSKVFTASLLSWAAGLIVPGKLGEFSLVPLLHYHKVHMGKGLAVALVDKVITVLTLGIISVIGLLLLFQIPQSNTLIIIIALMIILPIIALSLKTTRKIVVRILGKHAKKFEGCATNLKILLKSKWTIINMMLTFFKWFVSAIISWLFFLSLGFSLPIMQIFFINALATISALIPISINGLGVREGLAIYLYSTIAVPTSAVATVYLIWLVANYSIGAVASLFLKIKN